MHLLYFPAASNLILKSLRFPAHSVKPDTLRIFMQTRNLSTRTLALLLALLLGQPMALMTKLQAEAASVPQLPDPGTTGMNRQQQQQLGLQAMGEVYKQ